MASSNRGKLFYSLVGTCLVLAILCGCLATALVLHHLYACGSSPEGSHEDVIKGVTVKDTSPWALDYRLPADTVPLHYDILLHPDIENATFGGEVSIQVQVNKSRKFVLVHTKFLDIHDTELVREDGSTVKIAETFEYKPNEFWVIRADIEPGIYNMTMKFNGSLSGKIVGFYRSVYVNSDTNQQRFVLHKNMRVGD